MRRESGFTLVELLIAAALTGVLATVLGTSIFQITNVTEYSDDRLLAVHELQNSGSWLNSDGQMAVSAVGGGTLVLTFATGQTVTYAVSGTSLTRTYGGSMITLAQNISSANFSVAGLLVRMDLTSAPVGRMNVSEQGTYEVCLRAVP